MNIIYRALSDSKLQRIRQLRLWSFVVFMALGAMLLLITQINGLPYGMGPSGWPWAPADWYGVVLSGVLGGMLLAGGVLVFSLKMLRINVMVRQKSRYVQHFALAVTVVTLTILLASVMLVARAGLVAFNAASKGWSDGWVWTSPRSSDRIVNAGFSPDSQSICAWFETGSTRCWQVGRGKLQSASGSPLSPGPVSLSWPVFERENKRLAANGSVVEVFNAHDLKYKSKEGTEKHLSGDADVTCLALSAEGDFVVAGSRDGGVRGWEPLSSKQWKSAKESPVHAVALSPNRKAAASGHEDGSIRLWNPIGGGQSRWIRGGPDGHATPVTGLAFHPDGGVLLSMSAQSGVILLWDTVEDRKKPLARIEAPIQDVSHLALSPDGRYAILVAHGAVHVVRLQVP